MTLKLSRIQSKQKGFEDLKNMLYVRCYHVMTHVQSCMISGLWFWKHKDLKFSICYVSP